MKRLSRAIVLLPLCVAWPVAAQETPDASDARRAVEPRSSRPEERRDVLDVTDPMLEPIESPEHIVTDWREALERVRNRSTNYLTSLAQVDAARGQSRIALASSLPTLMGTGNLTSHLIFGEGFNLQTGELGGTTRIPDPATVWNIGATLRVPVLNLRNWYDYATSRKEIDRAELQADDAQRLIIGALAESLVSVVTTERLAEVTRVNLAAALSNLELNERRAQLGSGTAIDVLRARQEVELSRAQLVEADESVRRAREALGQALGYPEPWGVTPDIKLDQLRKDARDTCRSNSSVEDRSDVRAAALGAAIAERNRDSVNFSFLPTVDFTSTLTYNSFDTFTNRKPTTWTIGGSLTWHLYDGGLRYGQMTLTAAQAEQARQQGIQTERDARIEVAQAIRGVDVAAQSLKVAHASKTIAEDNAELARSRFLNGTGSSFDLVDTQRSARQTSLDVTVREFELLRAEIIAFLALASCEI